MSKWDLDKFEPEDGLTHIAGLRLVVCPETYNSDDGPDWAYIENADGDRVYIYARHTIHLGAVSD